MSNDRSAALGPPRRGRRRRADAVRQGVFRVPRAGHHRPGRGGGAGAAASAPSPARGDRRDRVGRRHPARRSRRTWAGRSRSTCACPPRSRRMTVTRACASGLQAITSAAAAIERGDADVVDRRRLGLHQQRRAQAAPEGRARPGAAGVRQGHPDGLPGGAGPADAAARDPAQDAQDRRAHHRRGHGRGGREDGPAQRDLARGPGRVRGALAPPRRGGHRVRARFASEVAPVETPSGKSVLRRHPGAGRHQRREARQAAPRRSPRTAR